MDFFRKKFCYDAYDDIIRRQVLYLPIKITRDIILHLHETFAED